MKYVEERYHTTAINWILDNPRCGIFLEMGLGKTAITLTALNELLWNRLEIHKVLVLAPLRPAKLVWQAEIAKWDHLKKNRSVVVYGNNKSDKIREDAEFYMMSYSTLPWLHTEVLKNPKGLPQFDVVVYDESTFIKNHSSNRWKYCKVLFGAVPRGILLTGTPTPNGVIDLWGQVHIIDNGNRLMRNRGDFERNYFIDVSREGEYKRLVPMGGTVRKITEKVSDICLVMEAKDHITLPPITTTDICCELTPTLKKKYDELERDMILEISNGVGIEASSKVGCQSKLRQFVQGFLYDENKVGHNIHKIKINAMKELGESLNGDPCLVAFQFRHEAHALSRALGNAPIINGDTSLADSERYIESWNRRELPFLLVQPASVAHGLNIQSGGRYIVHYGIDWNLEYHDQLNARLYRRGQTQSVRIMYLVMKDTMDEVIAPALKMKGAQQSKVKQLIKRYADAIH